MTDLIVVGAGLTGLVAAETAARAGLHVKVISKGLGALHWSAGTVDVLGYYPDDRTPINRPLETIKDLVSADSRHPYAHLNPDGLEDAFAKFAAMTQDIGLPYSGAEKAGENLWLSSPVGAARPTFFAPQAQLAGELGRPEPILICGLSGQRDFYPELIAENLNKRGHTARAAFLPSELVTDRRDAGTVLLAHALDNSDRQKRLAIELGKLLRPGERIGLPAILGMDDHAEALNHLQADIGAPVFEIPTLPPSVPGIRLNTALRRLLDRRRVRVDINMEVTGFVADGNRLAYLETRTSGRPLKHSAERFLLATGGILGGGIESDHSGRVWETVLNLPVQVPPTRGGWFRPRFFDPAGHPIFRAGVPVNSRFQPVDANGNPVYSNVWAAGSLLADADPIMERSLEGIGIATGIAAARFAAS